MSSDKGSDKAGDSEEAGKPAAPKKQGSGSSSGAGNKTRPGQDIDLEQMKATHTTQAPKPSRSTSTIAETGRSKSKSKTGPAMDWKFSIFACLGSMFLALTTHIFCINGGLVLFDKYNLQFLMSKQLLGKISQTVLTDMLGVSPLSQPWLKASFVGDQGEYGLNFVWYHTVHVYWHAITAGLVFIYILTIARHLHHQQRLKLNPYHLALASSVIFACHPLSSQTVSYLSARSALLGANNYFLSLNLFLLSVLVDHKIAKICFAALALITGAMSIWSNPECMTLPALALLSLLLIKHPLSKWKTSVQEHPIYAGATLAFAVLLPFLYLLGIQCTAATGLFSPTLPAPAYIATQVQAAVFYYLRCFLVPVGLSIDPPLAVARSAVDPFALSALALLAGLIYLGFRYLKGPVPAIAAALIFLGLLPHAVIIQRDAVADWVFYLPLAGASLFASYGLCSLSMHNFFRAGVLFAAFVLSCFGLSIYRDYQWGSNMRLWQSSLSLRPKSGLAHAMLSAEYLVRGSIDEAEKEVKLALAYAPESAAARLAEAKVLLAKGKYAEAKEHFQGTFNLASNQHLDNAVKSECRIGELESTIGLREEKQANDLLTKLISELSDDARIFYAVGMSAFNNGDFQRAFGLLDRAVSMNPSLLQCYKPMVDSALALGAFEPAFIAARANLKALDDSSSAKLLFARTAIVSKHDSEAEDLLKQLIKEEPKNAKPLYLLSRLYKRRGNTELWKQYREEAVKVDPEVAIKFALPELDATDLLELNKDTAQPGSQSIKQPAPPAAKEEVPHSESSEAAPKAGDKQESESSKQVIPKEKEKAK